jgi:hypothetical protein
MFKKTIIQVLLIGIFISIQNISAQYVQDRFIIGSWWEPCLSDPSNNPPPADISNFQIYKNAYFNIACEAWTGATHNQSSIDYALDVSSRVGLRYIARHENTGICTNADFGLTDYCWTTNPPVTGFPSYGRYITDHYSKLNPAQRAAQCGYFLGEEIRQGTANCCGCNAVDRSKNWTDSLLKCDPNRMSMQLAVGPSADDMLRNAYFPPQPLWTNYLDMLFNDATASKRPQALVYDHYVLSGYNAGYGRPAGSVLPDFFWGLNTARQKAGTRPFWIYLLATGHGWDDPTMPHGPDDVYLRPDENNLRFQVFCSIAYGAKGIYYFTYRRPNGIAYHDAIINDCNNTFPSQPAADGIIHFANRGTTWTKYAIIREINQYVTNIVGPAVMGSNFVNVYHKGGGWDPNDETPLVNDQYRVWGGTGYDQGAIPLTQVIDHAANDALFADLSSDRLMAGVYKDKVNTNDYYILVVNKSFIAITGNSLVLKGDQRNKVALYPRVYGYDGSLTTTAPTVTYSGTYNRSTVTLGDLAGGEGRLVKVTGSAVTPSGFRPQGEIAVTTNAQRAYCFARGTDNKVWYRRQEAPNADYWGSKWLSLGGSVTTNIVCGNINNLLHVFAKNSSNILCYKKQTNANTDTWDASWTSCNAVINASSRLCVSRYGAGQDIIILFKKNDDGKLWFYYTENGTLKQSKAAENSIVIGDNISAGYNPGDGGSVDVFVTNNTDKRVYRARMSASRVFGTFSALNKTGNPTTMNTLERIAVGTNNDNRLEAFIATSGYLWHSWQTSPGGSWTDFSRLSTATSPEMPDDDQAPRFTVGRHGDGHLEVFARGRDGFLKHIWQDANQCGTACTCWSCSLVNGGTINSSISIGGSCIAIANNNDGRPVVFSVGIDKGNIFYTSFCSYDPWWQPNIPLTNIN